MLLAGCAEAPSRISAPVELTTHRSAALTQNDGVPVMKNLRNARHLTWGPEGALYVAEAGRGGTGPCMIVLTQTVCWGRTGAVSRLWHGHQERVIDSLPSWAVTSNRAGQAEGPNEIAFNGFGNAYVTIGLEANPAIRDADPKLGEFGRLVHVQPWALAPGQGKGPDGPDWEFVADLGTYERVNNPDCGAKDSNPFGALAVDGKVIVADAGANALVQMDANGDLSTLMAFPSRNTVPADGCPTKSTRDFVPTSIVQGPDNAYYIGHLNGLPILAGSSSIWRLEPGGEPTVHCTGLTWIEAMAVDAAGNFYVVEHSVGPFTNSGGAVIKVAPDCTLTTLVTGLSRPTGIAVDDEGNIYVSLVNGINFAAEGQVRRFTP